MIAKPCEVCGSKSVIFYFEKYGYTHEICKECRLVRINPQPSDRDLDEIYNGGYYQAWGREESIFRDLKFKNFEMILSVIPQIGVNQGKKLLDVGAATGLCMEYAQTLGYEVYGVEAAKDGVASIQKKFGIEHAFEGYFDCIDFSSFLASNGKFDVITLCDLLEHVRDPNTTLKNVYNLLKDDGYLVIYLPNTGSLACKILRKRWSYFIPEHLYGFSGHSVHKLLDANGFVTLTQRTLPKYLTLEFACNIMFYSYKYSFLRSFMPIVKKFPKKILSLPIPLPVGQLVVLAQISK